MVKYYQLSLLIIVSIFGFVSLASAAPVATVDRTSLNEGESLRLILEGGDDDPDLSALDALFTVHGTSTSSQVSFVNGRMSSTKQWIVTLSPKRSGRLIIPAVSLGKEKTNPIQIHVRRAGSRANLADGKNVYIEVSALPQQPYVQSQVVYTVKLFHSVEIRDGGLSQPKLDDVVIERLGDDKTYQTVVNGRRYQVTERRYALFPQSSGAIVIPPTEFGGQVISSGRQQGRSADPFNRFFSQQTMKPIQLRSKSINLKVRARPDHVAGVDWLPARVLELSESWSQNLNQARVGEPITRTIRIEAEGLTGAQLPKISIDEHPAFKQYPDQPKVESVDNGESLLGIREDKIAIVPNQEGMITLPEIRLVWWSTRKNREEVAIIPSRQLEVLPAINLAGTPASPTASRGLQSEDINSLGDVSLSGSIVSGYWMWISLFLLVGWVSTGILWWRSHRPSAPYKDSTTERSVSVNPVHEREAIKRACIANDPIKARQALIGWARIMWPENGVTSLLQMANSLDSEDMLLLVSNLDSAIYSDRTENWNGQAFWDKCSPLLKSPNEMERVIPPLLPELYPQR